MVSLLQLLFVGLRLDSITSWSWAVCNVIYVITSVVDIDLYNIIGAVIM